jgi:hypothetical protein
MEEIRKEALENEAAEPAVVEETAEKKAGSRLEKPKKKRKAVWITLGVIAAVLVGGCAAVIAVAATSDTIFNDTSVLGVELGGFLQFTGILKYQRDLLCQIEHHFTLYLR